MTVPACSSCCFDQCAATHECHATDTGHDTPPNQSIQTQGRPNVLSIDVKRHFGQWGKISAPVYNRIKAVHIKYRQFLSGNLNVNDYVVSNIGFR